MKHIINILNILIIFIVSLFFTLIGFLILPIAVFLELIGNGMPNAIREATKYTDGGACGHSISISSSGKSGTDKNLPPFMALCYIMKL